MSTVSFMLYFYNITRPHPKTKTLNVSIVPRHQPVHVEKSIWYTFEHFPSIRCFSQKEFQMTNQIITFIFNIIGMYLLQDYWCLFQLLWLLRHLFHFFYVGLLRIKSISSTSCLVVCMQKEYLVLLPITIKGNLFFCFVVFQNHEQLSQISRWGD